jgi:hypothetical protein
MTRPNAPSQAVADRFPLSAEACRKLAALVGCEQLPQECAEEVAALLACHRRAADAERRRARRKAPPAKPRAASRINPRRDLLRLTCPLLRRIFEQHVQQGFHTRGNLRRFAFVALKAAAIATPPVDESHLDRLDEFLDAEPHPAMS